MLVVTSGDARSWYMISGDAKSWAVCIYSLSYSTIVHCVLLTKVNEEYWGPKRSTFGSLLKDSCLTFSKVAKLECSCSCVDGVFDDGASWSMDVDTIESAISTALDVAATGTIETTIVGELKYS
ncbi:hypothetical protein Tco_0039073 [Tanacetum coccineum]